MPHLHLSLQHGDDMILKRMKRRHMREDSIRFCEDVRNAAARHRVRRRHHRRLSDRDEAMFANSLAIVEECGLTHLHVFPFSPRPGTPAARMPQLDRALVKERAARLRAAGDNGVWPPISRAWPERDTAGAGRARRHGPHTASFRRSRRAGWPGQRPRPTWSSPAMTARVLTGEPADARLRAARPRTTQWLKANRDFIKRLFSLRQAKAETEATVEDGAGPPRAVAPASFQPRPPEPVAAVEAIEPRSRPPARTLPDEPKPRPVDSQSPAKKRRRQNRTCARAGRRGCRRAGGAAGRCPSRNGTVEPAPRPRDAVRPARSPLAASRKKTVAEPQPAAREPAGSSACAKGLSRSFARHSPRTSPPSSPSASSTTRRCRSSRTC